MQYKIIGTTVPAVEMKLNAGESVFTQSGGMIWQSDGIQMDSNTKGGLVKGFGRMLAGESLFMATYKAMNDDVTIAFAGNVPGQVIPIDIDQTGTIIAQKGAFLVAQDSVELDIALTKKFSAGLFGGEGFILQKIHGSGMVFLEVDGDVETKELAPGEVLKVDTGNVVAFEESVKYEIETIKGVKNFLFGGEGLFLTKLTGPGKVIVQTLNFNDLAGRIISKVPSK